MNLGDEIEKQTVKVLQRAMSFPIARLELVKREEYDSNWVKDRLAFTMADGFKFILFDDGIQCCESRYMMTDDNLTDYIGATLTGMRLQEGPMLSNADVKWYDHEQRFLLIDTNLGTFTMVTHNVHNGYYGGFDIVAREQS